MERTEYASNRRAGHRARFSLAFRITAISMLLSFVCAGTVSGFNIVNGRRMTIELIESKARSMAFQLAQAADGLVTANQLEEGPSADTERLSDFVNRAFAGAENVAFMYVVVPFGNTFAYIALSGDPGGQFFGTYEPEDTWGPEPMQALTTGRPTFSEPYWYDDTETDGMASGYYVTAFAPVRDAEGSFVAVAGIDIYFGVVNEQVLRTVASNIAFALVATLAVGITVRLMVSRAVKGSLKRAAAVDFTSRSDVESFRARASDKEGADWVSPLYSHFGDAVSAIEQLQSDIAGLLENHLEGNYQYRLDPSGYKGDYKTLAGNLNAFADMYINNFVELVEVVQQYGDGNLDANVSRYAEKWGWANDAVDDLRAGYKHLVREVKKLADNAAGGKFDKPADEGDQRGEWLEIIRALNRLLEATSKPLGEINGNLTLMTNGDFSYLEGSFSGEFAVLKDSCNQVNKMTSAYIKEIAAVLGSMADGDLTRRPQEHYLGEYIPIRDSIESMQDSLNRVIAGIREIADFVADRARMTSETSREIADGSAKQAANLEELSNALTVLEEKAAKASESADTASRDAGKARESVLDCDKYVKSMESNMRDIKESSESISKIIETITSIAFQTNLLAINASIEAARAGEIGKGFSVVADEVRSLAQRSQSSAKETEELISKDGSSVSAGLEMTAGVVGAFNMIAEHISEISRLVSDISEVSGEQLESISSVNANVKEIVDIVAHTSQSASDSSDAAQKLSEQAEQLRRQVSFFKLA